ncbi:MAG: heavy-metal-associated domain-containing protein [Flavobacteriaceae bacterium]|nr:heavy-metal-associated domain-containing protein [Flavobacteriaceae bacterium]MDZ4149243.1 heavy-metal-associated domain-containing protein [Flavobacteriaceae bacterium]
MKTIIKFLSVVILAITVSGFTEPPHQDALENRTYVKLEVDGLTCPFCIYGLEKRLKEIPKIADIYIDLDGGFATFNVPSDAQPTEDEVRKLVKKAGFTAKKIVFSKEPFKTVR